MRRVAVIERTVGLGYVRVVDHMGDDLSIVNAARASHAKESKKFNEKDAKLLRFLVEHNHGSPFRHAFVALEIKAPLMVARQWWKYVVGSDHTMEAWNEASRRTVKSRPEFYMPDRWYDKDDEDIDHGEVPGLNDTLRFVHEVGVKAYEFALKLGVTPEQARLMLPAYGMYTTWRWSCSLQSLGHFLVERLGEDAQCLIQDYAIAVRELTEPLYPVALGIWLENIEDIEEPF